MAKVDLYFTLHFWGDDDNIIEIGKDEMQEALDGMIDDALGECEEFNYKADLTNNLTGVTIERSRYAR